MTRKVILFLLQAGLDGQAGLGCEAGSRFRHQEPSHNRSSTGIRLILDRFLARPPCPQVLQRHPVVAKGSSIGSSARPPYPQVPQWHPRVAKRSCIGSSARRPCPQVPQWHPRVAKHSSDRSSARPPCPQMPQWHPRVAKRSSDLSSARPPCLQVPRWHPRVAKRSSDRASARRPRPTDASVASSGSHCEWVYRIVDELGFVKFTWHELLLIIK